MMTIGRKLFAFALIVSCMTVLCNSQSLLLARFKRQETPKLALENSNPVLDAITQFMQRLTSGVTNRQEPGASSSGDPLRDLDLSKIGLCDRITCTDLYKAIDDFRQSDLYLNLRGIFYLLQDDQGLQVIMSSLKDPETLKRFFRNERIFKDPASNSPGKIDNRESVNAAIPHLLLVDPTKISKSIDIYPTKSVADVDGSKLFARQVTKRTVIGSTRGPVDYFDYYYSNSNKS